MLIFLLVISDERRNLSTISASHANIAALSEIFKNEQKLLKSFEIIQRRNVLKMQQLALLKKNKL